MLVYHFDFSKEVLLYWTFQCFSNQPEYVEELLMVVLSFIMWSLLSECLSKSLIERVHWIYKCVYVFLRLGASVNLVLRSKTVDLGDWLENPEWQVHWPGIFTFALEACWLVFIFEMQILNLKNIVY